MMNIASTFLRPSKSQTLAQSLLAAAAAQGAGRIRERTVVRVRQAANGLFPAEITVARQVAFGWLVWSWELGQDVLVGEDAVRVEVAS